MKHFLVLACLTIEAVNLAAQTPTPPEVGVGAWLKSKLSQSTKATTAQSTPKQTQSISIDAGSTSLVDQSAGSDFVSAALNLVPYQPGATNTNGQAGSGTVTASAYSLYTLATKQDGLTPSIYNNHAALRQFYFTVGREQQSTSSTSAASTTPSGTVYGGKYMIANKRDAKNIAYDKKATDLAAKLLEGYAKPFSIANEAIGKIFCEGKPDEVACLNSLAKESPDNIEKRITNENRDAVNKVVANFVPGPFQDLIKIYVEQLQQRPQLSVSLQATKRSGTSPDDYFGEIIFDVGLSPCEITIPGERPTTTKRNCASPNKGLLTGWLLTVNGSYKYSNSPTIGADLRTERVAFQLSRNLTTVRGSSLRTPMQFNISGEGLRVERTYNYRSQVQLVIPISTGVDLPLSFGYGNQPTVLAKQEKGVYGKFGLTFDFGKIVSALKGGTGTQN